MDMNTTEADEVAPGSDAASATPTAPPRDVEAGGLLRSALALALTHPRTHLAPTALAATAGALATTLVTVVYAWTVPTLLRDGEFTFAEPSTPATVTAGVAVPVLALLTTVALAVLVLHSAGTQLHRPADTRAVLREVGRRWAFVLLWTAILVVTVVGQTVALAVLPVEEGAAVIVIPVLLLWLVAVGLLARTFPGALAHGIGTAAASRHIRALLRREGAVHSAFDRSPALLLLLVGGVATSVVWVVRQRTTDVPAPGGEAIAMLAQVVVSSVALATVAVTLTRLHLRATSRASRRATVASDPELLAWSAVDRCATAGPDAASHTADDDAPRTPVETRRARRWVAVVGAWVAVVGAWAAGPVALVFVVTTNPTLAIEPRAMAPFHYSLVAALPIANDDGMTIVSYGPSVAVCTARDDCHSDHWPQDVLTTVAAAADPDGPGVALVVSTGPDRASTEFVLVTCEAFGCFRPDGRTTEVVLRDAGLEDLTWLSAVAAHDGTYAVVNPTGPLDQIELILTRCPTASCEDPLNLPLGDATLHDVVRTQFAPDGTLWVLQTTGTDGVVRLRALAPDAATLTDALTIDLPNDEGRFWSRTDRAPLFRLSVRDDGTPVVLYRDPGNDDLVLVSCDDERCTDRTTSRLPIEPTDSWAADLAVDATGRPLVATAGRDIRLHSCADRACTSMRSGLVSLGSLVEDTTMLEGAATAFMVLDGHDRPTFVVEWTFANAEVLQCREARCGL